MRGGAVWQLVGLITRRSQVRILPPLPIRRKASTLSGPFSFGRPSGRRFDKFAGSKFGRASGASTPEGRAPGMGRDYPAPATTIRMACDAWRSRSPNLVMNPSYRLVRFAYVQKILLKYSNTFPVRKPRLGLARVIHSHSPDSSLPKRASQLSGFAHEDKKQSLSVGLELRGGVVATLPTATSDQIGLDQYLLGPEFLIAKVGRKGAVGLLLHEYRRVRSVEKMKFSSLIVISSEKICIALEPLSRA